MANVKRTGSNRHIRIVEVPTPEWGNEPTYVCADGAAVCAIEALMADKKDGGGGNVRTLIEICTHGICDKRGVLLYSGDAGLKRLLLEDFAPIEPCVDVILELCGFSVEDEAGKEAAAKKAQDAAKKAKDAAKEMEKNSKGRRGSSRSN